MTDRYPFGWPRIQFDELPSTMPYLAELARHGATHGTVVTTDYQTAGTGRDRRPWSAPAGSSLLMSVLVRTLRPASDLPALSLLMAHAVAETVEEFGAGGVSIKWPNDVLVHDKKISGILLRSRTVPNSPHLNLIAGLGLNLTEAACAGLPGATSLSSESTLPFTRREVLDALLERIGGVSAQFEQNRHHSIIDEASARLAYRGEAVEIESGGHVIRGMQEGLRHDGALTIRDDNGNLISVLSGELQRGPRRIERP
jgi:BirA family transcriptional regulator, biotin operon repressor / biotin---[acetyl-CoA-carboxylase] ligase